MKYSVIKTKESGQEILIGSDLKKASAIKIALTESSKRDGYVFVEFFRASDGTRGFLNPDGNHNPCGEAY